MKRASFTSEVFGVFMKYWGEKHGAWIVSVMYLDQSPTREDLLEELIKNRLLTMSRFHSVLTVEGETAGFVPMPIEDMDWEYHIEYPFGESLQTVVSENELLKFAGAMHDHGFDLNKPLWRLFVVPKFESGGSVLICAINHAIADGVSSVGALFKILDDSPLDPDKPLDQQTNENAVDHIVKKREKAPSVPFLSKVGSFFTGIANGLKAPFDSDDPPNAMKLNNDDVDFHKNYTGRKLVAKSKPLSLDKVKELKNLLGGTVNDVCLTLLTLTVKAFLKEIDDPILKDPKKVMNLRGQFPVSLRGRNDPLLTNGNPANNWNSFAFRYPLECNSAIDTYQKVKEQIDILKSSPQMGVQDAFGRVVYKLLDKDTAQKMILKSQTKASTMLSNVPGPQKKVHILGAEVKDLTFYLIAPIGVYLGILTYDGKVTLSINVDETLGVKPDDILKHWQEQFSILCNEVEAQYEVGKTI